MLQKKMHKKNILDTNIILRFLLNDNKQQAEYAEKLFIKSPKHSLIVPDLVVAEIAYVLLSHYEFSKEEVIDKLSVLLTYEAFKLNNKVLKPALYYFKEKPISFVDAYLCALSNLSKTPLITFDKKLPRSIIRQ